MSRNKEKIIELLKLHETEDSNGKVYVPPKQYDSLANELFKAIAVTSSCKSDSEQLSCDHRALISIGDGFGNTFCPMCNTYNPTT